LSERPICFPEAAAIGGLKSTPPELLSDEQPKLQPALLRLSAMISCSRSHDAVIRVYDEAGNLIETHEHKGKFKEW